MMKTRSTLALIGGMATAAMLALSPVRASATELVYSLIAPNHPLNEPVFGVWAAAVAKATDGRVTVKMLTTPAAPPPRMYDAIRTGIVDAGHMFLGLIPDKTPLMQLSMLPLLSATAEANAVALTRTYEKFFREHDELDGVKILGFLSNPGGVMCSLKDEPIDSVAALQKLKMWSLPGYAAEAMKALDAPVVAGPAAEMYALVSKGTVDGFNGVSIGDALTFKVAQYARSCTRVQGSVFTPTFAVMIGTTAWDSLSEEDRKAIEGVSLEQFARLSAASDKWDGDSAKAYEEMGGKIVTPSAEFAAELERVWTPMQGAWVAKADAIGIDGKAALAYFREQLAAVAGGN